MAAPHKGHVHGARSEADRDRLTYALGLLAAFIAVEVATGVLARSLALLSDAAHMLTDAGALALSLLALHLAARPAAGAMTFGFRRLEILSAQVNGMSLVIFAGFIAYEAVRRLFDPPAVRGGLVLAVALVGIAVNLAAVRILAGADRSTLNVQGSFRHVLTDLYGFIGTVLAAIVILTTGFRRADPIVSLLIAALMLRSGASLLRASGRVFLEAAPTGLDPQAIGRALARHAGVVEVHDLHVWEVSSGFPALSAHVVADPGVDHDRLLHELQAMLTDRYAISHSTIQIDRDHGAELIQLRSRVPRTGPEDG